MAARYDEIAEWYAGWVGGGPDELFHAAVEPLIGDVDGLQLLDLACGEGRIARYLASKGAVVLGVDISDRLLDIARHEQLDAPLGITYRLDDAQTLETVADPSFDGVVANMALMDIDDLDSALRSVARVLWPGGWFVFSILHPCFHTPASAEQTATDGTSQRVVSGYWDESYWRSDDRVGPPGLVGAYHRTLATYVNALTDAGFSIERALEPRMTGELAQRRPIWAQVPAVIGIRCAKHL